MAETGVLAGIVVVDHTRWIAGPYLTRLLVALGARVIKVEPPRGDLARGLPATLGPQDSGLFQQLNSGKESVCLDLERRSGRQVLRRLVARSHIFVHDLAPIEATRLGISYRSLKRDNPGLIMCSLTGFGQDGPLRDWEGSGGVAAALSGARDPMGDPGGPPQGLWGDVGAAAASTHGLSAVLAALFAGQRSGSGQHIDISLLDSLFATIEIAVQQHIHSTREGKVLPQAPQRLPPYRTRNGDYVVINTYNVAIWRRFTATMGNASLAEDPAFDTVAKRTEHADALHAIVQAWFSTFESADDVLPLLNAARVPAASIATTERAWRDPQLRQRNMFAQVPHPTRGFLELPNSPLGFSEAKAAPPVALGGPAPALGQHTEAVLAEVQGPPTPQAPRRGGRRRRAPFEDIRVLDFTRVLAGPYLARHLHDLGAQVIKVEPPGAGDDIRQITYVISEGLSGYFIQQNCGKLDISLDLKRPETVVIAKQLASISDVVLENYKPGVMAQLGLDYPALKAINPQLVMCSISGYGQTGPYSDRAGEVSSTTAVSGQLDPAGDPDGPPQPFRHAFGDMNASSHALAAIAAALYRRDLTGRGQYLDISILDCIYAIDFWNAQRYSVSGGVVRPRWYRHRHPFLVPRGDFPTADGRWLFIEAYTDEHWPRLAAALSRPELARDARFATLEARTQNQAALYDLIASWVRGQASGWTAEATLQGHRVPAAVVRTIPEAVSSPQLRERLMLVPIRHPVLGEFPITNSPYRFSGYRSGVSGLPPSIGEHNREVIGGLLGYDRERIAYLEAKGALFHAGP